MSNKTVLLAFAFLLMSCNSNSQQQVKIISDNGSLKKTIITSTLMESIPYYYNDSLNSIIQFILQKDKATELDLKHPILLFRADKSQKAFVILPGETYSIISNKGKIEFRSQSKDTDVTRISNFFSTLQDKTGEVRYTPFSGIKKKEFKTAEELKNYLVNLTKLRNEFANSEIEFLKKSIYVDYILKNLTWLNYNNYYELNPQYGNLNGTKNELIDSINRHPENLGIFFFRICAINSFYYLKGNWDFNEMDYDLIKKHYSGEVQAFLLAHLLRVFIDKNNSVAFNSLLNRYIQDVPNSNYLKLIDTSFFKELPQVAINENIVADINGEEISLDKILKLNQGKIVLIDLWASWCLPCIEEFEKSAKLKNLYLGRAFKIIYVSMDKDKNAWINFFKKNQMFMNGQNSYWLMANFGSSLAKQYNIITIPRYMLIGKDGKIISADAPRPSDPQLKKIIDMHLKK